MKGEGRQGSGWREEKKLIKKGEKRRDEKAERGKEEGNEGRGGN